MQEYTPIEIIHEKKPPTPIKPKKHKINAEKIDDIAELGYRLTKYILGGLIILFVIWQTIKSFT